jgi:prophage maintenance system killer protein
MRYTIEETYIYEVEADTPELAADYFHEFMQANDRTEEETGVKFLQNTLNVYDIDGKEV